MAIFGENCIHAWCQLEQSGTHSTRDSYNIAGVEDKGTGRTRLTFSTDAINNDYAWCANSGNYTGTTTSGRQVCNDTQVNASYFQIRNTLDEGGQHDDDYIGIIVVSDN